MTLIQKYCLKSVCNFKVTRFHQERIPLNFAFGIGTYSTEIYSWVKKKKEMYQRCNRRIQLPENKRPRRIQKEESLEPEKLPLSPSSSIPLTRKPKDSGYKIASSSLSTKCTHFMGKIKMDVSLII